MPGKQENETAALMGNERPFARKDQSIMRADREHGNTLEVPREILRLPGVGPGPALAYAVLQSATSGSSSVVTCSATWLGKELDATRTTAGRWLKALEAVGLIKAVNAGTWRLMPLEGVLANRGLRIAKPSRQLEFWPESDAPATEAEGENKSARAKMHGATDGGVQKSARSKMHGGADVLQLQAELELRRHATAATAAAPNIEYSNVNEISNVGMIENVRGRMLRIVSQLNKPHGVYTWCVAGIAMMVEGATGPALSEADLLDAIVCTNQRNQGGRYFFGVIRRKLGGHFPPMHEIADAWKANVGPWSYDEQKQACEVFARANGMRVG